MQCAIAGVTWRSFFVFRGANYNWFILPTYRNTLCRYHTTHSSKLEVSQAVWTLQWNITACLLRRMVEIVDSAKSIAKRYREFSDSSSRTATTADDDAADVSD